MLAADDLSHILAATRDRWEDLRGERIFITGGTGFVGTWLLAAFAAANRRLALGAQAVVLSRDPAAFARKAPQLAGDPALTFLAGNALDFSPPAGAFPFVIHAATEPWVEPSAQAPLGTLDADLRATRHVLDFARAAGTRRLLFTSSGAVYGRQPSDLERIPEDYRGAPAPDEPRAAYGEGKRVSEFMCLRYAQQYGFVTILARLFAFVGPYLPLDAGFAVGNFIADVLAGRTIRVAGDGTPYRSYLYAADLAVWLWSLLFAAAPNRAYNVGSPEAISILDLARTVRAVAEVDVAIDVAQAARPDAAAARYIPDTHRAATELGLRDAITLDDGLRRTLAWQRAALAS